MLVMVWWIYLSDLLAGNVLDVGSFSVGVVAWQPNGTRLSCSSLNITGQECSLAKVDRLYPSLDSKVKHPRLKCFWDR